MVIKLKAASPALRYYFSFSMCIFLIRNYYRTKVLPGAMEIVSGSMASVSQVDISSFMKCGKIMKNRKS